MMFRYDTIIIHVFPNHFPFRLFVFGSTSGIVYIISNAISMKEGGNHLYRLRITAFFHLEIALEEHFYRILARFLGWK